MPPPLTDDMDASKDPVGVNLTFRARKDNFLINIIACTFFYSLI